MPKTRNSSTGGSGRHAANKSGLKSAIFSNRHSGKGFGPRPESLAFLCFLLMAGFCLGCASAPKYRNRTLPEPIRPGGRYIETGMASWYGEPYHGRATASGEIYDMNKLTAAHNRLPLQTVVKVTYLKNKKTVVVKINDRGPFKRHRILDLSYAAAQAIGLVGPGSGKVRIEVVQWGEGE